MEIYLDHNATSKPDRDVLELVMQAQQAYWANPSSTHALGRKAKAKYLSAKDKFAKFFNVTSQQVFFVSTATEAINWLIFNKPYKHIVSSDLEHAAIYNSLKIVEKKGTRVSFLSPKEQGFIDAEMLTNAITEDTDLIILGAANSETGIIQNLDQIAELAKQKNIPIYVDAVGLLGRGAFKPHPAITAYVLSSHKIHGPKGIACLIFKNPHDLQPLTYGGYQENGKKAGTENLASVLGFAEAFEKQVLDFSSFDTIKHLRNLFEETLKSKLEVTIIGEDKERVHNTSCIRFHQINAETLLTYLDHHKIYASHGSACSSGALEPSRVLLNMGLSPREAKETIRFSLSKYTTEDEILTACQLISEIIGEIKKLSQIN